MDHSALRDRGLVILGCGKMGSALLQGWLEDGFPAGSVSVIDPKPSEWLQQQGVPLNAPLPDSPAILLVAVKPQIMAEALPTAASLGGGQTLVLSVAAGIPLATYEDAFGSGTPIIRAMPNTPAAVGRGITAIVGNLHATDAQVGLATELLSAVGEVVHLASESDMDAVTGVSGSGPAYVFHLVEALAAAAEAEGLAPELAMKLARATVAGAGALLDGSQDPADQLRMNVTSPGGTTAAGLSVLMPELPDLMTRTVAEAAQRSRELSQ